MKIANKVLLIGISAAILSLVILLIITLNSQDNQIQFKSILIGDIVGFSNFVLGLVFIFIGINRPDKFFLMTVYGGILIRLFVLSVIVVIILKTLEINVNNFILSWYFHSLYYVNKTRITLSRKKFKKIHCRSVFFIARKLSHNSGGTS